LKNTSIYFLIIFALLVISCSGSEGGNSGSGDRHVVDREDMVRANQFLTGKDMELIEAFVKRRNWDIKYTGTGLGYEIYENGSGAHVTRGSSVTIEYTVSLLDGRICYSSEEDGPMTFRAGRGGVEAGLEEGVLMLRRGDKARLIIPPFLAHGLIGDQNRIPPRAVIIYELEVTGVSGSN